MDKIIIFIEHTFQPGTTLVHFLHPHIWGFNQNFNLQAANMDILFLKNRAMKTFYFLPDETQDSVIQFERNI